jgi:hypothetical protein
VFWRIFAMVDSQSDPLVTILTRYKQLCTEHSSAQENVDRMQAHQRGLMAQINDCFAAARVFGFDLVDEFQRESKNTSGQPRLNMPDPVLTALFPMPVPPVRGEVTIKDLVLDLAEKAYPAPVRASRLRHDLISRGHDIHEKTVGMTLYRLSQAGYVRRIGSRDWFFVPEEERELSEPLAAGKTEFGP